MGYIYYVQNQVNKKGYVGQTTRTVAKRFIDHKSNARRGVDFALYRAMRKYGIESFTVEEVAQCDNLLLNDLEEHYIKLYGTYAPLGRGYNETENGYSGGMKGHVHSEETKTKIAASLKGKPKNYKQTLETIKKRANSNRGTKRSLETRKKMSSSRRAWAAKKPMSMTPQAIASRKYHAKKRAEKAGAS